MIHEYAGRTCDITTTPVGVVVDSYVVRVTTKCGEDEATIPYAVPVATLRQRAEQEGTTIQQERDKFIAASIQGALASFKDKVDLEALNDGI